MLVDIRKPHDPDVFFDVKLKPNASFPRERLPLVMGVVVGVSGALSIAFFSMGAWPVIGFMGLDVLGVYLGLKYYLRYSDSYERVRLDRDAFTIIRYHAHSRRQNTKEIYDPSFLSLRQANENDAFFTARHRDGEVRLGEHIRAEEAAWVVGALKQAIQARQRALVNSA